MLKKRGKRRRAKSLDLNRTETFFRVVPWVFKKGPLWATTIRQNHTLCRVVDIGPKVCGDGASVTPLETEHKVRLTDRTLSVSVRDGTRLHPSRCKRFRNGHEKFRFREGRSSGTSVFVKWRTYRTNGVTELPQSNGISAIRLPRFARYHFAISVRVRVPFCIFT